MKKIIPFISIFFFLMVISIKPVFAATIGSKFAIATETQNEFSVSAAFDGTNYLIGIQGDASEPYNITAQLVSPSGTLVGSRISVGRTGGVPVIAFDGTNYLMVWTDDANYPNDDIYGQFISKTGTLVGTPFVINQADGPQNTHTRNVVYDGSNYFVVWDSAPVPDGCNDEYGQFVKPSGQLLGSPIKINQTPCGGGGITLAYDGSEILAVWLSEWTSGGTQNGCTGDDCEAVNVVGQFITKSGAVTPGALSGTSFWLSESPVLKHIPSVSFDGTNYLVVFPEDTGLEDVCGENGCNKNISGYLVTTGGSLASTKITVTNAAGQQIYPLVAYDGTNHLVLWLDYRNDANNDGICDSTEGTCADIYGQFINKSGTLQGSEIVISNDSGNQFGTLTFDRGKYLVIRNDFGDVLGEGTGGDVYGQFITVSPAATPDLTVSKAGIGSGTVTSDPLGIDCGGDCSQPYASGTVVTLTAAPAANSVFAGWSGGGCSGTGTCTVTMNADTTVTATFVLRLAIGAPPLPEGEVGVAYIADLEVSGGVPPYTVAIIKGSLSEGLGVDSEGIISGTPTKAGSKTFTVKVTDQAGNSVSRQFTIKIFKALSITTKSLPKGKVGKKYSATLKASGGKKPYAWSLASGSLPAGLVLSSTGNISGIPTAKGKYSLTFQVSDSLGGTAQKSLALTVN